MKIRFLGPNGRVTGSCYWLRWEERDIQFLVDCGIRQGAPGDAAWNRGEEFPFDPSELDFVILTHAHVDHCGMLPWLYKNGFDGTVYATRETQQLAELNLKDSASRDDSPYSRRDVESIQWHEPGSGQVFNAIHPVDRDLFVVFYRNAHLTGSVSVSVLWGPPPGQGGIQRSILFSGDVGPQLEGDSGNPLTRFRMRTPKPADYLILESTYGSRVRDEGEGLFERRQELLRQHLVRAIEQKGVLLIPAFAIGRTQHVLFDLYYLLASEPRLADAFDFYLDGGMAQSASGLYLEAYRRTVVTGHSKVRPVWLGKGAYERFGLDADDPGEHEALLQALEVLYSQDGSRRKVPFPDDNVGNRVFQSLRPFHRNVSDTSEAVEEIRRNYRPSVVLSSSGMCCGGAIMAYLDAFLGEEATQVLFTGYQHPSSNGGRLLNIADISVADRRRLSETITWETREGAKELPLSEIRAQISRLTGYSGHADQRGLVDFVFPHEEDELDVTSDRLFLTHGDDYARWALKSALEERAAEGNNGPHSPTGDFVVRMPEDDDPWFDLEEDHWVE